MTRTFFRCFVLEPSYRMRISIIFSIVLGLPRAGHDSWDFRWCVFADTGYFHGFVRGTLHPRWWAPLINVDRYPQSTLIATPNLT